MWRPTRGRARHLDRGTERTELAAHEYIHLWQYALGGDSCMVGVRWIAEGMAESFAYRALIADGLIPAANLDTFTKRQLTNGVDPRHAAVTRVELPRQREAVRGELSRSRPPSRAKGIARDPRLVHAGRKRPGLAPGLRLPRSARRPALSIRASRPSEPSTYASRYGRTLLPMELKTGTRLPRFPP